jgi:predicted dehydrogenase
MSQSSLGVAVIGAGMAGRAHIAGYRAAQGVVGPEIPDVRLVAVADVHEQFASQTARRYGYERAEISWQAVAEAKDVDVVSVVVANSLHREVVEGLLAAGKHVLCEKPLAPSVEDAEAMVAAAEARPDLQAATGFTFRRSPAIAAVRQHLESGAIGKAVHFNGHYWCDYGVDPNGPMSWRYKGAPGSGALSDIGSHVLDLAEFLCGPVTSVRGAVFATTVAERALPLGVAVGHAGAALSDKREPVENEDLATFTATFASGATGTFSVSRVAAGLPNSLGFELFTSGGAATFDLARPGEFGLMDFTPPGPVNGYRQVLVGPDHPYIAGGMAMDFPSVNYGQNDLFVWQCRAFLEQVAGVTGGLPPVPSLAHGLRNVRLLSAVAESVKNNGADVAVA